MTAHIEDDLLAMEVSCWDTFLGPEQENILIQLLHFRELPDNLAFIREFCEPDPDQMATLPESSEVS